METSNINGFNRWRSSERSDMESIVGASRQIAHLAGVNLDPKGRVKKEGETSVAKFTVRPKPLKWRGINGWERIMVIIRHDGMEQSFVVTVDGKPVTIGPMLKWLPIRKAADAMEKACSKIKNEEPNDR